MIEISEMREADIAQMEAIPGLSAFAAAETGYFAECHALQLQGKRTLFVARLAPADGGGKASGIAGYVILNYAPTYALYKRLGIPEIQDLNVRAEWRGRGYGRQLIAHCEAAARQAGYTETGISFGLHKGFGAAQRLYVRMGYVPDGYGVTWFRDPVQAGEFRCVDDNLCLMLIKEL